ncbi:UDP-D-xylose:L-fucose alpha-1,3-D-xylosyltransferase 3-like isoform X1 [Acanthaster planci]|uniref:UDP-D-xylose:L-fucose alpha-1,3-D-xylosyltransferase 3-like isoform X1 n=1 Tax=Acanthaster planci TaxID=133434 RepID=A0A8B7XH38_ACAPL|nr:UDP-D-xylose:L-fucose alpha-1,3-D-xylosyltransferase 3-like isoform X1 [Acanthaster planci]
MPPPSYFPRENRRAATISQHGVFLEEVRLQGTPRVYIGPFKRRQPVCVRLSNSKLCYQIPLKRILNPRNFVYLVLGCFVFVILANARLRKSVITVNNQLRPVKELIERSHDGLRHNALQPLAQDNQPLSNASRLGMAYSPRNNSTRWPLTKPGQALSNHTARNDSSTQPLAKPGSASSNHEAGPSGKQPRVVLLVTNQGFVDFTENLMRSMERASSHPNITIITEDQASFTNFSIRQPRVHVIKTPDLKSVPEKQDAFDFGVKGYVQLINRRPGYVLGFLQKGFEVFFVDSDSFWFKDPFPYFQGDFDVAYPKDAPWAYNAGIGFYKPTAASIRFLKHWIQTMATQAKTKKPQIDQFVMNSIIRSRRIRGLRVRHLKDINFPCAKYYSKTQKCDNYTTDTVLVHAAYLAGHELKKTMFEQCKLWLL